MDEKDLRVIRLPCKVSQAQPCRLGKDFGHQVEAQRKATLQENEAS